MNLPRDQRSELGWSEEEVPQQERRRSFLVLGVFVCACILRRGGLGGVRGGRGNKLSHCRKVCSSKSHLPARTRAMPEGCEVRGQDVPLQGAQITYPLQSINWLLSVLHTPTILFPFYRLNCGTASH